MQTIELTGSERDLLKWLSSEDFSQYGECRGRALNALIEHGLAKVHGDGENQSGFIAKGRGEDYRAVSLTDAGRAALASL
jgi:hypothetical protein